MVEIAGGGFGVFWGGQVTVRSRQKRGRLGNSYRLPLPSSIRSNASFATQRYWRVRSYPISRRGHPSLVPGGGGSYRWVVAAIFDDDTGSKLIAPISVRRPELKALNDRMKNKRPISSVCKHALQFSIISGFVEIQGGASFSNKLRIKLGLGLDTT